MTETSAELEVAGCLSLVASAHGFGVSTDRFFELIREADEGESVADQIGFVWRQQFPSGRCQSVEPESLEAAELPVIGIDTRSGHSYLVRDISGAEISLRNLAGDSVADRNGIAGWSFLSLQTGRRDTDREDPVGDAGSWFRMAFAAHRVVFRDVAVASALVSLLALCAAIYTMQVYDRVVPTGSYPTLLVLTVGVVLGILLEASGRHIKSVLVNRSAEVLDREIGQIFFDRTIRMRLDQRPDSVGTLSSQLRGFETVRAYMTSSFLFLFADLPFALFFLLVIFWLGGSVALVPLTLLIISAAVGLSLQGSVERNAKRGAEEAHRRNGLLIEALDGAEALKAVGAGSVISKRWRSLSEAVGSSEREIRATTALATNISQALQQLSYVGIVAVGSFLVAEGNLTLGALIACSILGGKSLGPIAQLPQILTQAKQSKIALTGLEHLTSVPVDSDDGDLVQVPESIVGDLRLEEVAFGYEPGRELLSVPGLTIKSGERVAVLGPTGSGKTSLLRVLSGICRPSGGRVFLDNYDMSHLLSTHLRGRVRYIPQDVKLFSGSLRDNLRLGLPLVSDDELMAASERSGLIRSVMGHPSGLDLPISESGSGLSGGQRQLVALTRVLLGGPSVILLDEPTSGMDRSTERQVIDTIFRDSSPGTTIVIVTHKTTVLEHVDRVVILDGGRVVCDGPRSEVVRQLTKNSRGGD